MAPSTASAAKRLSTAGPRATGCSRRGFLKGALVVGASAAAAPYVVASAALGQGGRPAASERVVLGYIGNGPRGMLNLREQLGCPKAQLVAVCDVWENRRENARQTVDNRYGSPGCKAYRDFRELLARTDIDAVGIATPDHWHVPITIAAVRAGKDVHVEKPLGISIAEDLACRAAVRRHGAVLQYGAESRSWGQSAFGAELVRNGRIGQIREIRVKSPNSAAGGNTKPLPVPAGLDYDLWLGPAPWRPYTGCPNSGNNWWHVRDYALGFLAGWGAHPLDLLVSAVDAHLMGPWEIEGDGVVPTKGCNDAVMDWNVRFNFANGVKMKYWAAGVRQDDEEPRLAALGDYAQIIGTEGWVALRYMGLDTEPDSLRKAVIGPNETHMPRSPGHEANFIDCVLSRKTPVCPIADVVRSDAFSHLSDIAVRTARKITWDPIAEQILGDADAARMTERATREPWII
jgi:predicted dehydrogenase